MYTRPPNVVDALLSLKTVIPLYFSHREQRLITGISLISNLCTIRLRYPGMTVLGLNTASTDVWPPVFQDVLGELMAPSITHVLKPPLTFGRVSAAEPPISLLYTELYK